MWSSSRAGQWPAGIGYDSGRAGQYLEGVSRSDDKTDNVGANNKDKEAVSQLLKELEDAEKTSKNQTVQDLRDKLNELREELGEEKFKRIIDELKKDAYEDWLAWLKRLFPDLFPDEPSPGPPSPSPGGGGGGGGGG
ncbi:hypothetical protein F3K53_31230, partial [Pseudomonas veronii]